MLLNRLVCAFLLTAVCIVVSPVAGQTADSSSTPATITEDRTLLGSARFENDAAATDAQVSLVLHGKVIDLVSSDDAGEFSFPEINPAEYQIVCSTDCVVCAQSFNVGPCVEGASPIPADMVLRPSSPEFAYDIVGSAPLTSYSSSIGAAGGGGGLAGGFGSRLGGGLLSGRRLLLVGGLVGGLAAIDGEDASPDL